MHLLTVFFAFTLSSPSQPSTFADAEALAKAQNKPLVVYFHASWCAGCKHFDKQLANDDFKDLLEKVIFFTTDCFASEKHALTATCEGLTGYPSFQIRQHGKIHEQWLTSDGAMFRKQVEHYLSGSSFITSLIQAYAKTPSIENGEALAKTYSDLSRYEDAFGVYKTLHKQAPSMKRRIQMLNAMDMMVYSGTHPFEPYIAQLEKFILDYPEEQARIAWAIDRIRFNLPQDLLPSVMPKYWDRMAQISKAIIDKKGYPYTMYRTLTLAQGASTQGNLEKGHRQLVDFFGKDQAFVWNYHLENGYQLDALAAMLQQQKQNTTDAAKLENIAYFEQMLKLKLDPAKGWEHYQQYLGENWQGNPQKLGALLSTTRYGIFAQQALANGHQLLDLQPDPDARRRTYKTLMNLAIQNNRWQALHELLARAKQEQVKHSFFDYWANTHAQKMVASQ